LPELRLGAANEKRKLMQDRLNIAVFVDYDNIEIGVKSTLRREFDVAQHVKRTPPFGLALSSMEYRNCANDP